MGDGLQFSRIAHGMWRLDEWDMRGEAICTFLEQALDWGVTTIDIADIYGAHTCESILGEALQARPALRRRLQLVTKCGIKIKAPVFPHRRVGHYDTGYAHIIASAEQSLRNLRTDVLDMLLIHRPDPLMDPSETARAFEELRQAGKVLHFGVSNFRSGQFEMLQRHCPMPLLTNQVEFSALSLEHMENDNTAFFLREGIVPMAWSPLAGGRLFDPRDARAERVVAVMEEVAAETGAYNIDMVAYAWILRHPARFIPIVGSGKPERLRYAVDALSLAMSTEQWFRILVASQGHPVP